MANKHMWYDPIAREFRIMVVADSVYKIGTRKTKKAAQRMFDSVTIYKKQIVIQTKKATTVIPINRDEQRKGKNSN